MPAAMERHGRIDILVNNAGITRDTLLLRMKREDWDAVLQTNLTAAFACSQAVLKPMLKQQGGRIVNITSVVGQRTRPGPGNYAGPRPGDRVYQGAGAGKWRPGHSRFEAVAPGF
jgi:3-oxoacyl-[acyl-carrier protein] reductase